MVMLAIMAGLLLTHRTGRATGAEQFRGKPYTDGDLYADTWVATDALGRTQPGSAEAGPVKENKWVGIFYWT